MFELLFKYSPVVFQEGDLAFGPAWPGFVLAGLALLVAVPATLTYLRARGESAPADRAVLAGIRLAAFALLLFCLLRPTLVLSRVVPQQNFLGILLDDSRSMEIQDRDGAPRSAFVEGAFGPGSELVEALSDRFVLRYFRFSDVAERLDSVGALRYLGTRTRLGPALDRAREELSSVPLSGLVVVSDGADNSDETDLSGSLLPLQAAGVPVYAVGVGRERLSRDIQLSRVDAPRRVLLGTSVVVDAVLTQTGFDGRAVSLQVEDQGRIVSREDVTLPGGGEPATVRLHFTADQAGPRIFRFRVPPQDGEQVTQNNVREILVEVEDGRKDILYFEGEPRYEVGFMNRVMAEDQNLRLVILQRTAENKFLRLNVEDGEELAGGFPRTREELFRYQGLILGSVEAGHFTTDQLAMIEDFVSQRGGGLLMLGGRRSFAEGGYGGTPVARVLPVVLEEARTGEVQTGPAAGGLSGVISALVEETTDKERVSTFFDSVAVSPTRAGSIHPVTRILEGEDASRERWEELPPLSFLNPLSRTKPGATVLLEGDAYNGDDDQVILAFQRYGPGKGLAFTVQDSWLWQMHADIPLEDMTHERLWRQLLRWMVDGVPEPVTASVARDRVEPGVAATLVADVGDATFLDVNNGDVRGEVVTPSGEREQIRLDWTVDQDGRYESRYVPREAGLYEVEITAASGDETLGTDRTYLYAAPGDQEYFDPGMRAPLLRRVARETGGRFYTPDDVASLADDVTYTGGGVTVREALDLWDMPALLLLLVVLVGAEWGWRRARGLA